MIKRPIESQDQILLPALRVIPTLLSSTLHAMQNSQTLQRFLSPLYIDGHEHDNIVAYRQAFIHRWADYKMRFHIWDNGGGFLAHCPSNLCPLILVTHDESTFF